MPVVRIEHAVPDYERWKQVFDSDPVDRKGAGVRRYQVLRLREDPNTVFIDLAFDTLERAEAFVRTMEGVWDGPGRAITREPRVRILELVEDREP